MADFFFLIPIALALGDSGQYDDLDGAAERILFHDDAPLKATRQEHGRENVGRPRADSFEPLAQWARCR